MGDSAGHCLPLTAEGIRTAFYFGIACGRELRAVVDGRQSIASALARYDDFSEGHRWKFEAMLRAQRLVPRVPPRLLHRSIGAMQAKRFVDWSFGHYLNIAPPSFAAAAPPPSAVVADELDVVAVGVEHVGAVVAGVVDAALARRAVVAVAGLDCRGWKASTVSSSGAGKARCRSSVSGPR